MRMEEMASVSLILALIGTILLAILVIPEKRRDSLNSFFKAIADICNFKQLIIEKILKFLYTFLSLYIIVIGFFTMFSGYDGMVLSGLLTMILGPVIIRIAYELIMMTVLLVKNVIDINKKLPYKKDANTSDFVAPAAPTAHVDNNVSFTEQSEVSFCPNCGTKIESADAEFCGNCGQKLK